MICPRCNEDRGTLFVEGHQKMCRWCLQEIKHGGNKMATLKESAAAYEPPQTLNIADLEKISIDIELKDAEGKNEKGEVFTYKYAEINGKKYRVAGSIIGGIKALMEKIPDLKTVSVVKQGTGMNTRYTVVPAD